MVTRRGPLHNHQPAFPCHSNCPAHPARGESENKPAPRDPNELLAAHTELLSDLKELDYNMRTVEGDIDMSHKKLATMTHQRRDFVEKINEVARMLVSYLDAVSPSYNEEQKDESPEEGSDDPYLAEQDTKEAYIRRQEARLTGRDIAQRAVRGKRASRPNQDY
jgi:hypothetical protein